LNSKSNENEESRKVAPLVRQLGRSNNENPSVGVILCSSKNAKVVEYTISRTLSPTMVSEYKLRLIDKELLEEKLKEIIQAIERNKLKTT